MVYCVKCGAQLPDGAAFCYKCGAAIPGGGGAAAPVTAPTVAAAGPSIAPAGATLLKCPACGGPIHPTFGEMVITCDYCGGSVSLGGAGWKEISKHSMLALKVTDPAQALKAVQEFVDQGFMHRRDFEESKVAEAKLSFVPFWVIPASASTTYQYQAVATSVGATVGTMAAGAVLGSVLSRGIGGGGTTVVPIFGGSPVNSNREETISGQFEYPVVAVKSMTAYQPKNYSFALGERTFFDKKGIPEGSTVLNGDLAEDAAQHAANAWVQQLQSEAAHKKHHVVSKLKTDVNVSEGELLHVPIWSFFLEHKGQRSMFLVDAHAGRVMQTVQ